MATTKPTVQRPWADTGTKTPPNDGRRNTGYVLNDIPTRAEVNALINELTRAERYLMQTGISDWDAAETYVINDQVRDATSGLFYKLTSTSGITATRPGLLPNNWAPMHDVLRAIPGDFVTPLVAYQSALRNRGWGVDALALPAGQVRESIENWDLPLAAQFGASARWTSNLNGGTVDILTPGTVSGTAVRSPRFHAVRAMPPTGSAAATFIDKNTNCEVFMDDDLRVSLEVAVALSAIGANRTLVRFGLMDAMVGDTRGVSFGKGQADTNWKINSPEVLTFDGLVPPVANTYQRLRIELLGANQNNGTSIANFKIDGTLVGHLDNPVSNGAQLRPIFGAITQTTGGAAVAACFGPMRLRGNMFAGDVF
jgi:hypothetical protein